MLAGAPSRLPPTYPLHRALAFAQPGAALGAWVRSGQRPVYLRAGKSALLAGTDLGFLLRRCARVLIRDCEGHVAAFEAERLIAWRTLQIVVGAPYLPRAQALRALYPGLRVAEGRIALPLGLDGAEPALAACAAARVPVSATWIEYRDAESG